MWYQVINVEWLQIIYGDRDSVEVISIKKMYPQKHYASLRKKQINEFGYGLRIGDSLLPPKTPFNNMV